MLLYRMPYYTILQAAKEHKLFLRTATPMFPGTLRVALSTRDNIIFGTASLSCSGERLLRLEDYVPIFAPFVRYRQAQYSPFMYSFWAMDNSLRDVVLSREAEWRRLEDAKERHRNAGIQSP